MIRALAPEVKPLPLGKVFRKEHIVMTLASDGYVMTDKLKKTNLIMGYPRKRGIRRSPVSVQKQAANLGHQGGTFVFLRKRDRIEIESKWTTRNTNACRKRLTDS